MKYTEQDYEYLEGKKFSSAYFMKLENNPLYERIELIKHITEGKSVIHVGCCDHVDLIKEKMEKNRWLHRILEENCEEVLGIDICEEAVNYVNVNNYSQRHVYCADITSKEFKNIVPYKKYDYVLLGEILEHVDNPVCFLTEMNNTLKDYGFDGKYIITVPNAFSLQRLFYLNGVEGINTDHKYWFTPFTLGKVLTDAGIVPQEVLFASFAKGGNGKNKFTEFMFVVLETLRRRPSNYKSFRGSQLVVIGKTK